MPIIAIYRHKRSGTNAPLHYARQALIDTEDYSRVAKYKWSLMTKPNSDICYAQTKISRKSVLLHRFITNCPSDRVVDHINHDGLDNRKSNLRITSQLGNMANQRIKLTHAPHVHIESNLYRVKIAGKYYGYYKTEAEAASVAKQKFDQLLTT